MRFWIRDNSKPLMKGLRYLASVPLLACMAPPVLAFMLPLLSYEGRPDDPTTFVGCAVLRWDRRSTTFPKMFVTEPGKYCVDRDYTIDLRGCIHNCGGQFIDIRANEVEIDLRGHTLTMIGRSYGGIQAVGSDITIRNGRIKGSGWGVVFDAGPPAELPPGAYVAHAYDIAYERHLVYTNTIYGKGGARIENMIIETDREPIAAAGTNVAVIGNTIRAGFLKDKDPAQPGVPRKFIATEPAAMISIYGPNTVVEGNTIEQTNRTGGRISTYSVLLRDAKGAVVRNNRIRNSGSSRNTAAVGLIDSADVVLEGNTFVNIQTPVAAIGPGSTFAQKP